MSLESQCPEAWNPKGAFIHSFIGTVLSTYCVPGSVEVQA